jgi:hypothetical protein
MRILIMLSAGTGPQAGVVPYDGLIEVYYLFSDAGAEIVLAAPGGGSASEPIRPEFHPDDTTETQAIRRRYHADRRTRDLMNDLVDLADVCAEDFDAALYLSPQVFDSSAGNKDHAGVVVNQLLAASKPVAMIGERSACTVQARNGLLMIGHSSESLRLAATALLGAATRR